MWGTAPNAIEVAERSPSGVGRVKGRRPATPPIHNAGPSIKPKIT